MENNVSVEKIQEGIEYLENQFMKPLVTVGNQILDNYKQFNSFLKSEEIDRLIQEQQSKLDELQSDLTNICNKAKASMDDSSKVIAENQTNINDTLSNI